MAESTDEESEIEKQVFNSYFDKLVLCIQHSTLEISNKSLAKELIGLDAHSEVLYGSTIPRVKATKLLSAVIHSMEHHNPRNCFESFLEILDDLRIFQQLTNEIRCSLEKKRSSAKSPSKLHMNPYNSVIQWHLTLEVHGTGYTVEPLYNTPHCNEQSTPPVPKWSLY